jgi:hypothetical protein
MPSTLVKKGKGTHKITKIDKTKTIGKKSKYLVKK